MDAPGGRSIDSCFRPFEGVPSCAQSPDFRIQRTALPNIDAWYDAFNSNARRRDVPPPGAAHPHLVGAQNGLDTRRQVRWQTAQCWPRDCGGTGDPSRVIIMLPMRRRIASIITLFYVLGTAGIAVAVYDCVDCGVVGVVAYPTMSPKSCYVDACCDDEQDAWNIRIESDLPCCDVSTQAAPENGRVLLPDPKHGHARLLTEALAPVDNSRSDTSIAALPSPASISHASISLPLLI